MKRAKYEHNEDIRYLNEACPFRVGYNENSMESGYNWHENIEIVYVTKGHGNIQCDGVNYQISEGTVAIVNSDTIHYISSSVGLNYYFIIVDSCFFHDNGITVENYYFEPIVRNTDVERNFILTINAIERLIENENELNGAKVRAAMLELLIELCSDCTTAKKPDNKSKKKDSQNYVRDALKYINNHYLESVTLEEIAAEIGITKYYLIREFKKCTGQTIISYINRLRCRKAEIYLSEGLTITEAAYESGFESAAYFSRAYKKLRGYSPSEYKRNIKNNTSRLEIFPS